MNILLLGRNGQLGSELAKSLLVLGDVVALNRSQCDLSLPESIPNTIEKYNPDIIVNAAAYTAVDKAEEDEAAATIINATAVAVLAEQAKKHNALLVHYSTDYVFDGLKQTPYVETDAPNPINAYGRTKLLGETAIQEKAGQYLIFRTSWVYAAQGSNFVQTILRLAQERDELKVISDQIGSPTSAQLISAVTVDVLEKVIAKTDKKPIKKLYHLTASGEASWYDFAKYLTEVAIKMGRQLKVLPEQIVPIPSAEYVTSAKRPLNSRLDTTQLCADYEISLPSWGIHVEQAVAEMISLKAEQPL